MSASILESGLDLSTIESCRAAIYTCLVFYVSAKITVQVFLCERAHAIRAHLFTRFRDIIWLVSMAITVFGFGAVATVAFIFPIATKSAEDGRCRIGLPYKVSIPLLGLDCIVSVALTGVFLYLLRPFLKPHANLAAPSVSLCQELGSRHPSSIYIIKSVTVSKSQRPSGEDDGTAMAHMGGSRPQDPIIITRRSSKLHRLAVRSLIGGILVLLPTLANLAVLYQFRGREQGWLCFTFCTLDGTSALYRL